MRTFKFKYSFLLLVLFLLFNISNVLNAWESGVGLNAPNNSAVELDIDNDFTLLYGGETNQIYGDLTATGDSVLNVPDTANALYSANSTYMLTDTSFNTHSDPRKRNSSQGTLSLPSYVEGKHIQFAGLFWQGFIHESPGAGLTTANVDSIVAGWNTITLKTPDGNTHSLTASLSEKNTLNKTYHYAYKDDNSFHYHYSAFVNVTDIVKATYSSSTNVFTAGNILTTRGQDYNDQMYFSYGNGGDGTGTGTNDGNWLTAYMGYYSGWSLIVVYSVEQQIAIANDEDLKTVSIYDGFDQFVIFDANSQLLIDVDISNFLTPKTGTIDSKLLMFGGAGDYGIGNDVLEIYNPNTNTFDTVSNNLNPTGRQFNSSYTNLDTAMSSKTIRNGVDLDIYDISSSMGHFQNTTKLRFGVERQTGTADQIFPQVLAFSTQLYVPEFCYDYAYKQQGKYFTELNDGSKDPELVGDVIKHEDVNVTIFIRNLVDSDIEVTDMTIDILDINTTQATYTRESTYWAMVPRITPEHIPDSNLVVDDSYIKDIDIGAIQSNDYFYIYYTLNPEESHLDMPLNIEANYNLKVGSVTIPYSSKLGSQMQLCSTSNFKYEPVKGQFNLVHQNYYNNSTAYYNLPTQITSREGNFKVISMDPNNLDTLKELPNKTPVAIELIDVSSFHDTFTACKELDSAISPRIWVSFDANTSSTPFNANTLIAAAAEENLLESEGGPASKLPNSYDFYKTANENTAFRISYIVDKNNTDILNYTDTGTGILINNFTNVVQTVGQCSQEVFWDKANGSGVHSATTVATACGNAGTEITYEHLDACLECIYGTQTQLVCSRDNFSIRPEALLIKMYDQNDTGSASYQELDEDGLGIISGVSAPTARTLQLASAYKYHIEVNATNHQGNDASPGYTKTYGLINDDRAQFVWNSTQTGCNDDTNKTLDIRFLEGYTESNVSVNQVGEYYLNKTDEEWTTVDNDTNYMTHHVSPYFSMNSITGLPSLDCVPDTTTTIAVNAGGLNGCNISSNHDSSGTTLKYRDYNIEFHPYKFVINNIVRLGLNDTSNPRGKTASIATNPFVYMSNINTVQDENMSVHFDATITATGKDGTAGLTNFVQGCYAEPLDFNITKSPTSNSKLILSYRYHDYNATSGNEITANALPGGFINYGNEDANITLTTPVGSFAKDLNGTISTRINLNFNRDVNVSANPEKITFIEYKVADPNNLFYADLTTNKKAEGNVSIDQNVTFYYGRTAAKKTRKICDTANANCDADEVFIYYEVYCHENTNNNWCSNAILPKDINGNSLQKVDTRWFQSLDHNITTYGQITNTIDLNNPTFITLPNGITHNTGTEYISDSTHRYQINNGLPYTADMNDTVPNWLIHDEHNASAVSNSHTVIFRGRTEWSGEHEADSTTKTDRVKRVNRRTMW